jgi:hypothetical protein
MAYFADLTTLADIRNYVGSTATSHDLLYTDLIQSTSREMEEIAGQRFGPSIETRRFDTPAARSAPGAWYADDIYSPHLERKGSGGGGNYLRFDAPLLEALQLTNGDDSEIVSADYLLEPPNETPKLFLLLANGASAGWLPTAAGEYRQAIQLRGVWGWHPDYGAAWLDTLGALTAAIATTGATTFACTTGRVRAGDLLRIDSEYLYVVSVTTGSTDTVTVRRGVNGSTAAAHDNGSVIYRWHSPAIMTICKEAVVAYQRLKNNPVGDVLNIGGNSFQTPKDVSKWIRGRLAALGALRQATG